MIRYHTKMAIRVVGWVVFLGISTAARALPFVNNGGFEDTGDRTGCLAGWNQLYGWETAGATRCGIPSVWAVAQFRDLSSAENGWTAALSVGGCTDAVLSQDVSLDGLENLQKLTLEFDYYLWALDVCDRDDGTGTDQLQVRLDDTVLTALDFRDDVDAGQCWWRRATPSVSGWTHVSLDLMDLVNDSLILSFEVRNLRSGPGSGDSSQLFTAFVDNVRLEADFEERPDSVPDGGGTFALAGFALMALGMKGRLSRIPV